MWTEHTAHVLLNRIKEADRNEHVVAAVEALLKKLFDAAEDYTDPDPLIKELLADFAKNVDLSKVTDSESLLIGLGASETLKDVGSEILIPLFHKITDAIQGDKDAREKNLADLLGFIRIGLLKNIRSVTDNLMSQLDEEDAIIALMMDIVGEGDQATSLYKKQMRETAYSSAAYPGRIFPFVAVNTNRKKHLEWLKKACEEFGFVGVKLYPSLGYEVQHDSPGMPAVYQYCDENNIPLLMHCSNGGFYFEKSAISFCDPSVWDGVLSHYKRLKICFGHFGGDENMTGTTITPGSWTDTILKLMDRYPGRVYADIAFHTASMAGGKVRRNYFRNLSREINTPARRTQILFGTDYFMVRQQLRETNHWEYFEKNLSGDDFDQISKTNPARFLGLPIHGQKLNDNMVRYLNFIEANKSKAEHTPAKWLKTAAVTKALGHPLEFPWTGKGSWDENNRIHKQIIKYFRKYLLRQDQLKRSFYDQGTLELMYTKYWNAHTGASSTIKKEKVDTLARQLDARIRWKGKAAKYKSGVSQSKAVDAIKSILGKGRKTLAELAEVCEKLYTPVS